jgi:hypothetical protein
VAAALADGRLSVDKTDLLTRASTGRLRAIFARDEGMLVGQVAGLRFTPAKKVVAYWKSGARDEVDEPFTDKQTSRRQACCDRTFKGGIHVSAFLPRVDGTIVHDEWHRLERELFEADLAEARAEHGDDAIHHLTRTGSQRMADALVLMAKRSAGADRVTKPRPLFSVLVGYETFRGRICELEDGTMIEPEELRPYLAEADVERIVFDGPSRVIDVGAKMRFFKGATRRAVQMVHQHCQDESGCDEPISRSQVDHDIEYEDGGLTIQANGTLKCGTHNRAKHRRKRKRRADQHPMCDLGELRRTILERTMREHPDYFTDDDADPDAHAPPAA